MIEVVISSRVTDMLQQQLLASDKESCAALLAQSVTREDGLVRLLVREVMTPEEGDYNGRSVVDAELTPTFVSAAAGRAAARGQSVIFAHSHPGNAPPEFSSTDDRGEAALASYLRARLGEKPCAAIVVSRGGWACRELGTGRKARVVSLGEQRVVLTDTTPGEATAERFDRQVRAFGPEGQHHIAQLRVAIVGLGGTGSLVAQQLAHLGVRDFLLIDPDSIETTNLNRVVGATPVDVRSPKVAIAARMVQEINPDAMCKPVVGNIVHVDTARELTSADVIFGCTDSHGSRAVLQQVSYQYLIPCFDMGTTIAAERGQIKAIVGRVQLLAPDLPCFSCSGLLDSNEVRRDMMSPTERKLDPYILGHAEPAPAVISLNATVASLAVTMFMATIVHWPSAGRYVIYNAITSSLRCVSAAPQPNCYCCSQRGYLARGESVELAGRGD
jgi:molybdopterin/thiamine biosynthesis adenylyltransferase